MTDPDLVQGSTSRSLRIAWVTTAIASFALIVFMLHTWRSSDCCAADVEEYGPALQEIRQVKDLVRNTYNSHELYQLPTGIYVQSLSFVSAFDVRVTGRIWQHNDGKMPDDTKPGVIFPDAVTPHDGNLTPIYDLEIDQDGVVTNQMKLWNFQVTLRQSFDYSDYPLDAKTIWIRMWTNDIHGRVQLIPDLMSYPKMKTCDLRDRSCADFGVSKDLVPGEWKVHNSFFAFRQMSYCTNFGRHGVFRSQTGGAGGPEPELRNDGDGVEDCAAGRKARPELRFYITLERKFTDAFLVNLVPLFVILGLLFGLVMTVTRDRMRSERFGFSTLAVYGSCSGLFFLALVGHIQIRREFAGSQMVYLEYFYIMTYVLLMLVSIFTFLVTQRDIPSQNWFLRNDGINLKLAYWPALLLVANIFTVIGLA